MIGAKFLTPRMKWVGLGGLVTVWFALVYVNVIAVPPPQEVPLKHKSGRAAPAKTETDIADVWEVHSLQAQARELPGAPKKNIFAATTIARSPSPHAKVAALQKKQQALAAAPIIAPPVPAAPPPPSPEELARQQEVLAAQAAQQQEHRRRQQLQEQMAQYRYLGYVNQNGVQKAFLGKGREIYILRQGETLEGKFQVALIEATTVKLLDADSKLETTLRLKKEESSAAGT